MGQVQAFLLGASHLRHDPELEQSIINSRVFDQRYSLLNHCIHLIDPRIAFPTILEFGVNDGDSLRYIAQQAPSAMVVGFDSCEGLPEAWDRSHGWSTPAGSYKNNAAEIGLPKNVEFIPGWFKDSLPVFVEELRTYNRPSPNMIHIDCDIYSSTVDILTHLKPHIQKDCILVFDELMDFRDPPKYLLWREHEWKALMESGIKTVPIGRTNREQVALKVI